MRRPHYLGFVHALVFAGLGGCTSSTAQTASPDPDPGPGCPARVPTENTTCAAASACRYYSGPPDRRSLSAECVCQPSPSPPALAWSCRHFQNRGPLPPPDLSTSA